MRPGNVIISGFMSGKIKYKLERGNIISKIKTGSPNTKTKISTTEHLRFFSNE